jgi:AraC-like DNA-binding protein
MELRTPGTAPPAVVAQVADPIETVISLLRPQVVLSKVVSGAGDWSIRKPPYAEPSFCLMLEGSCWLSPDGLDPIELTAGDFLLLPHTPGFTLASAPALAPADLDLHPDADSHYGPSGGPNPMRMLGGYFRFDRANAQLLVELLPPTILVRGDEAGSDRLSRIVDLISDEAVAQRPVREPILERLVEILLIEACRFRTERPTIGERGLIAGLSDPQLAQALRELHTDIAKRWTVEKLARSANMSRAVFAEHFANTIGMPPMQYVLEWRMAVAKDMLRWDRLSVGEIALRIGYQSASAFTTAFTRTTGDSPRGYARASVDVSPQSDRPG